MGTVLVLSFSRRPRGNCGAIAEYLGNMLSAEALSFADMKITPCGDCDYQCFQKKGDCPYYNDSAVDLYQKISGSSMVYFIVPNYRDYPCSGYFSFNERGCCYFGDSHDLLEEYLRVPKRFIVVSNTHQAHFTQAFQQHVKGAPDILFLSAKTFGRISLHGDLAQDPVVCRTLDTFCKRP